MALSITEFIKMMRSFSEWSSMLNATRIGRSGRELPSLLTDCGRTSNTRATNS
jgi:hypothetical protein